MLFQTHIIFGILIFLFFKDFFFGGNEVLFFLLVLLGSILPDIDEQHSKINRWSGIIGKTVSFFVKHRGIIHSLIFFSFLFFILSYFWTNYYGWALFLGYLSHIIMDGLTPMGVRIFFPFSKFKIKGPVKVGSLIEGILFVIMIISIVLKLI